MIGNRIRNRVVGCALLLKVDEIRCKVAAAIPA